MKPRKLTFENFNLDGEDIKLWRGIKVYCSGVLMFLIHYNPNKGRHGRPFYWIEEKFFPQFIFKKSNLWKHDEKYGKHLREEILTQNEVKQKAQEMFDVYVGLLTSNK